MTATRIFDNGGTTADRYTIVYLDTIKEEAGYVEFDSFGFNETYWMPDGIGQHGMCKVEHDDWSHLGKRIFTAQLPKETRLRLMKDNLL